MTPVEANVGDLAPQTMPEFGSLIGAPANSAPVRSATAVKGPEMSAAVAILAYKRPDDLRRCIDGVLAQARPPQEIIVTVRDIDEAVLAVLAEQEGIAIPLRVIVLQKPGVVVARNAVLAACQTDIVAFLDDDTVPKSQWLDQIVAHFTADARVGGVGGKDRLHDGISFNEGRRRRVGQLQWFGRVIADHHMGYGPARDVVMLKGANMAFRAAAFESLRIDERLRGTGSNEDLYLSLAIHRRGWILRYDPAVEVDHFSGRREEARHYADVEPVKDVRGFREWAFNEVLAIWSFLPGASWLS